MQIKSALRGAAFFFTLSQKSAPASIEQVDYESVGSIFVFAAE